ncbi:MAG: DUF2281 domain-containing protein [Treponema sp.]|nr:DUF2281 domain-containing protein [Treponema sp.]
MPFAILEKQISALPYEAQQEVVHYVGYLYSIYNAKKRNPSISEKINAFMKANPDAFDEFEPVRNAGIEAIRELTKNDSW